MTINKGKPHAVGDRGQRYEVQYIVDDEPYVYGWTDELQTAKVMVESINLHPTMQSPMGTG